MFEELFENVSFAVVHKIAPYALERQQFLEHCREHGFAKTCLKHAAGILLTAVIDLQTHGVWMYIGLASRRPRPESSGSAPRQASLGAPASTAERFSASRRGGFCSRGISVTRHRDHGRTRPCSTTSPSG